MANLLETFQHCKQGNVSDWEVCSRQQSPVIGQKDGDNLSLLHLIANERGG